MKYRSDFVTNSSSSSFVIAYKSANDMVKDLNRFVKFSRNIDEYLRIQYERVVYDIFSNRLTYTEALKTIRRFAENQCWSKFAIKWNKEKYSNQKEWVLSPEYNHMCKIYVEKVVNNFKEKIPPRSFVSIISYSDSEMFYISSVLCEQLNGVYMSECGD